MLLDQFNALPYDRQLVAVFDTGHSLMTRWEEEFAFKLYELPGRFLIEVEFDTASNHIVQLRSVTNSRQLEDYGAYFTLPDWLT